MSVNVYTVPHERSSPLFAKAFAKGCGGRVLEKYEDGIWAGFPSPVNWPDLERHITDGKEYYYGDHAYFGKHEYFRVTHNAIQHTGLGDTNGIRLQKFWPRPKPFKREGASIVLCPHSEHFFVRHGMTQNGWIEDTRQELRKYTDRRIIVHHKRDNLPLSFMLRKAWAVVGFKSMSALEAIMHGVPAVSTGECAVSSLCTKLENIEKPYYPDDCHRMKVAGVLADNQWTLAEMASGKCWRDLHDKI